jgi:hypothetical protein
LAKIYPEHLPESVVRDPKRQAERQVFDGLAKLGPSFVVFYSVAWQSRREGRMRDGEADFVVAHPDFGVLVIEVKGGGVAFDAQSGEWTTTDRYGDTFTINPVQQAVTSKHTLLEKLRDLPQWDSRRFLNMGHVVCFPDVIIEEELLRLDLPRVIIIDHNDLKNLEPVIRKIFEHYMEKGNPSILGKDRLAILESMLGRSFKLSTPLGIELDQEDERLIRLTERQYLLLNMLGTRRRALIAGCAGSGKTMLAMEKTRRLHEQGFNVLLTCFNAALAEDLAKRLPEVTVLHFHGLCREMAKEHGFAIRSAKNEAEYNDIVLPDMLAKAVDQTGPLFDAVIVDEGQDFKETYWIALEGLLTSKDGIFYVFYDDNQNLYGGAGSLGGIIDEEPFLLPENCRNTKAIHKIVNSFYSDKNRILCNGPEGRVPELYRYKDSMDMLKGIQNTLNKLINEEYILTEDLVVLTPHGEERSALKPGTKLGNFVLGRSRSQRRNEIQVSTIHRFKGLERKVVIIAEIDSNFMYNPDILMYVGSSRARTHLLFFAEQDAPKAIVAQIEAACKTIH